MAKKAISVTLDSSNLTWLKGRATAARLRSVSELIDRLVTEARSSGPVGPIRSVVGTIDIASSDVLLANADDVIRTQFSKSLRRPFSPEPHRAASGTVRRSMKKRG